MVQESAYGNRNVTGLQSPLRLEQGAVQETQGPGAGGSFGFPDQSLLYFFSPG